MRTRWDLSAFTWTLRGWRQHDWELGKSFARTEDGTPDVPPLVARVPGSVRGALVAAGIVPSPYRGTDSRASEWIENRHWSYTVVIPDDAAAAAESARLVLVADSLDYAGVVLVDSTEVGRFEGSLTPVEFDVTDAVAQGGRTLTIVFTHLPDDIGQVGRTSEIREWKARFNYGWDWTPRIVQVGIAGPIALEARAGALLDRVDVATEHDHATGAGSLRVRAHSGAAGTVRVDVTAPDGSAVATAAVDADGRWHAVELGVVETWQPHTRGDQPLYTVAVHNDDDRHTRRIGFRSLRWLPAQDAPAGAEPWILEVNGEPLFLAGVNWVPVRPDTADVTPDEIRARLLAYREIGVVILRVWGGAALEQRAFYDLADELGFLVWQELPLSSSGIDNLPPADDAFVGEFARIAASYAERIAHHASLVLWGGGNELTQGPTETLPDRPIDDSHPAIAAAKAVIAEADPARRFVATSPLGPSVWAFPENFGTGIHHDVHGPWEFDGPFEDWRDYWDRDDALLRSEVGMGGASGMDLLEAYDLAGPTSTPEERAELQQRWRHSSAWWLKDFARWEGEGTLAEWVDRSQRRQAKWLSYAARATLDRFPAVGGFIVWLGHDTFPCAVSLSLLDFEGRIKPVGRALGEVFRGR